MNDFYKSSQRGKDFRPVKEHRQVYPEAACMFNFSFVDQETETVARPFELLALAPMASVLERQETFSQAIGSQNTCVKAATHTEPLHISVGRQVGTSPLSEASANVNPVGKVKRKILYPAAFYHTARLQAMVAKVSPTALKDASLLFTFSAAVGSHMFGAYKPSESIRKATLTILRSLSQGLEAPPEADEPAETNVIRLKRKGPNTPLAPNCPAIMPTPQVHVARDGKISIKIG